MNALVAFEVAYLISSRRLDRTIFSAGGLSGNHILFVCIAAVLALQLLFTYSWPLNTLFATQPVAAESWLNIGIAAVLLLLLVELEKLARSLWHRNATLPPVRL